MRVIVTADHNATALREHLTGWLEARGHEVKDLALHVADEVVDYPPLCADLGRRVVAGEADFGLVLGGSGSGEAIAANKVRGVRAALCHGLLNAEIARAHNDANVLVVGAKVVGPELAEQLLEVWLATPFKGGRHQDRLDQIAAIERGELGESPS